jgi:hypothetical protein
MNAKKRGLGKGRNGIEKSPVDFFPVERPDSGRPDRNTAPGMDWSIES